MVGQRAKAVVAVLVVAGVGLAVVALPRDEQSTAPVAYAELADAVGCERVTPISELDAPIRGGAASEGAACETSAGEIHIFRRAAEGADGDFGGSERNIRFLVGADTDAPCSWLLLDGDWFLLAETEQAATTLASTLDVDAQQVVGASPTFSYIGPGGCGTG